MSSACPTYSKPDSHPNTGPSEAHLENPCIGLRGDADLMQGDNTTDSASIPRLRNMAPAICHWHKPQTKSLRKKKTLMRGPGPIGWVF